MLDFNFRSIFVVVAFIVTAYPVPTFAKLEEVFELEQKQSLKTEWAEKKRSPKLTEGQLVKFIQQNDFSIGFAKVFKPVYRNDKLYASPQFNRLTFKRKADGGPDFPKVFDFKSCRATAELFRKHLQYKELGTSPTLIRYNDYFVIHDDKVLLDLFSRDCEEFAEKSSFDCPESGGSWVKIKSKVGPLLTYESGSGSRSRCGGGGYWGGSLMAIDLRAGKSAAIEEFFEKQSINESLRNDPVVKKRFETQNVPDATETIIDAFKLKGFAVYDLKVRDGKIRVRWAFDNCESMSCPGGYGTLGLDLVPKRWFRDVVSSLDETKELTAAKGGM